MTNEPLSSEKPSGEPAEAETGVPAEFDADAELVLAALGRMEAAIRGDRATLGRLRIALGETASVMAEAKRALHAGAIKPDADAEGKDIGALLNDLEHRIDAMMELMGGERTAAPREAPPLPEPAVEPEASDRVPTVSDVVSRLNRGPDAAAPEPPLSADIAGGPTVSMLQAMVEALHMSQPEATEPAPAAELATAASEAAAVTPQPPAVEAVAEPEPSSMEPVAEPPPAATAIQAGTIPLESELLASVAQLQTFPIMPPEVGAAVIFAARAEPEPPAPPEPEAAAEAAPADAASAEPDLGGDLDAFLFGPDLMPPPDRPEADAPAAIASAGLPTVDLIAPPAGPAPEPEEPPTAAAEPPAQQMTAAPPPEPELQPQPEPRRASAPDPLAPLKAMTANERLALFS